MNITRHVLARSWRSWYSTDLQHVGPQWLQLVWSVLFAAAVALVFTLFGVASHNDWAQPERWWRWYRVNFVISLAVALAIHALFAAGIAWFTRERIRRFSSRQRGLFFIGLPMLGVLIGWPLGVWLVSGDVAGWVRVSGNQLLGSAAVALLINSFIFMLYASRASRLTAEKQATEAQLRLLQAQIEPHFLFNTLANVQSLMDHDLPKARQMLSSFTDYLRASLGALHQQRSTLAQELELARSYLLLLQSRMEDRLHFSIDADPQAQRALLPPLLLQPLVENAIVHGLEPAIDGGTVQLRARVEGQRLVLEVQDDGRGLDAPPRPRARPGAGMALDNIRQRLLGRYGSEAALELRALQPGTLARITLPLEEDDDEESPAP
jgi:signal transduction histidine kinase